MAFPLILHITFFLYFLRQSEAEKNTDFYRAIDDTRNEMQMRTYIHTNVHTYVCIFYTRSTHNQ